MNRPLIICHMLAALDGKITGPFMEADAISGASDAYEHTNGSFDPDAWLCGRVTTEENFTSHRKPDLDEDAPTVPEGDYVADSDAEMYYVSADASGKVGWQTNTLTYKKRPPAHVIELLSKKASNAYRAFLRDRQISYVIAGDDRLDCKLAAEKLKSHFGIEMLMVSGGGGINWSFLEAGVVDELSLVIAPVADGETDTPTVFERSKDLGETAPVTFRLKSVEKTAGDSLWLRYAVDKT